MSPYTFFLVVLTMSLLTAQLRTSLGDPGMPLLFGMDGCGVTLDDRMIEEFVVGAGKDALLARKLEIAEHLPVGICAHKQMRCFLFC